MLQIAIFAAAPRFAVRRSILSHAKFPPGRGANAILPPSRPGGCIRLGRDGGRSGRKQGRGAAFAETGRITEQALGFKMDVVQREAGRPAKSVERGKFGSVLCP